MKYKKTAETHIDNSRTLDRKYYTDKNILKKEYNNIFHSGWMCTGHISEFDNIGSYKVINSGNESALIIKDSDGLLKAYYNVCRHRGTRIKNSPCGNFSNNIRCKYHGWTYKLNGKLISAPHMEKITNFKKNEYSLHSIALQVWDGFIFINFDNNQKDFNSLFSPLKKKFKQWNIKNLKIAKQITYEVSGNWKLIIQNYSECYHCPIIHPKLAAIHNYLGGKNDLFEGPFLGGFMEFNDNKESITSTGNFCCPPIPTVEKKSQNKVYYYSIFPNLLLSLHPDYVMFHIIIPQKIDKTRIICGWLFMEEILSSDKYNISEAISFWDTTNKEDWNISEQSQLGIKSKKYSPSPYSSQESLLASFDNHYLKALHNRG